MSMKTQAKISASMMCATPFHFAQIFQDLVQEKVEYLHLDIMDGFFVPNLGLSLDWIRILRDQSDIPCDYHLMTINPDKILPLLALKPGDIVSIHYESTMQILRTLENAKNYGVKVFLAINPGTPISVLDELIYFIDGVNLLLVNPGFAGQKMVPFGFAKTEKIKKFIDERGVDVSLEVDGNITFDNAKKLREIGADIFVAGTSSIFSMQGIRPNSILKLRQAIS